MISWAVVPQDMEGFQSFQNGMILDFLRTHLGQAGPRASSASASGAPGAWAPPAELHSGRWGRVLEGGPLREHAAGRGWAPKQRAAVKAVLQSKARAALCCEGQRRAACFWCPLLLLSSCGALMTRH